MTRSITVRTTFGCCLIGCLLSGLLADEQTTDPTRQIRHQHGTEGTNRHSNPPLTNDSVTPERPTPHGTFQRSWNVNNVPRLTAPCRVNGSFFPADLFALDTCARCYTYVPDRPAFFAPKSKWRPRIIPVISSWNGIVYNVTCLHSNGITECANLSDASLALRHSLANARATDKWTSCCHRAVECCQQMAHPGGRDSDEFVTTSGGGSDDDCPPTWDGWQCWPRTGPAQIARAPCPHYIYFETEPPACTRFTTKNCTKSGTWYRRLETEWTDYTPCVQVSALQQRTFVHIAAYGVSTAALLPALCIFFSYKQLDVYRIRLHKNLFASILLNCIMVILFKAIMILPEMTASVKDSYIKQNALSCRILFISTRYFRLTNYMWMFCEGYYLHRLITAAFAEQKSFAIFYLLGWFFPLIPTAIYALIRSLYFDANCWVTPIEDYEWILNTPCLVSLVVNMIFLINIIRILVIKLRTTHSNEPSQYRKAVRATLVLVPLFGLHFIVTIYRPPDQGCDWIEVYYYVDYLLDGLQGCLVAIIFCYANGEVHYLLKRSYQRFREERFPDGSTRRRGLAGQQSHFLGRSTCGSTNFTLVDSPNPMSKFNRSVNTGGLLSSMAADSDHSNLDRHLKCETNLDD